MQTVASLSPMKTEGDLTPYEITAMIVLMEGRLAPGDGVTPHSMQKQMRRAGFTDVAASLSLESLNRRGFMEYTNAESDNGIYTVCALTTHGLEWMLRNQDRFKLVVDKEEPLKGEDIPF